MLTNEVLRIYLTEQYHSNHPLSSLAKKLGATVRDGIIALPSYKVLKVGDYGYTYGLGKAIFCFGEYKWENPDVDGYVENDEEDKTTFCGFYWLRSRGGDLDNLPSPQYNNFKVEGNIFEDYVETGKIKDDLNLMISTIKTSNF